MVVVAALIVAFVFGIILDVVVFMPIWLSIYEDRRSKEWDALTEFTVLLENIGEIEGEELRASMEGDGSGHVANRIRWSTISEAIPALEAYIDKRVKEIREEDQ